jgi:hypothetical protein
MQEEAVDNLFARKSDETIARIQRLADMEAPVFLHVVAPRGCGEALPGCT